MAAGLVAAAATGMALDVTVVPTTYAEEADQVVFRIESSEVTESSSLVVSTTRDGLAYTTNDSGDAAVVYVVDTTSGEVVGRTTLAGVDAVDIEALGGAPNGSLVVADIGDNSGEREQVTVYRIRQPRAGDRTVTPKVLRLTYVDGPRDAESVLYDSKSGRVFVVSKEFGGAHFYRTGSDAFERGDAVLRPVAAAPPLATDATYLPGRDFVVVRGYGDATVFRVAGWKRVERFDLPAQEQGESIAAPRSGDVVWVGTEGDRSPVTEVSLPELPEPSDGGPATPGPTGSSGSPGTAGEESAAGQEAATDADESRDQAVLVASWIGGAAAVGLVIVVLLLITRSRRSRHA